jgi:hypothetical protein
MDTLSESKIFYDIETDQPVLESSDVETFRVEGDMSLDEMYEECKRRKSQ